MKTVKTAIIHCSATRPEWMKNATSEARWDEIKRWHVDDNKWSDIGYHYGIDRDGTLHRGRPTNVQGAHTRGHNRGSLGIVLLGGYGSKATDQFNDHFTPAQDRKLIQLLGAIKEMYPMLDRIAGHNEFSNKACPGFHVPDFYPISLIQ